jgi:hypothetical protein
MVMMMMRPAKATGSDQSRQKRGWLDNEINQQQQQRTKANDDDEMNNKSKEGQGKGSQTEEEGCAL